jgi:phenylalanyl-tRNA synthetase alpha chain
MTDSNVLQELEAAQARGLDELKSIASEEALLTWRNTYLGKHTAITQAFQAMGGLSAELRPQVGQAANKVKLALEAALAEKTQALKEAALAESIAREKLDVTLPGRPLNEGRLHPDTQMLRELFRVFGEMGSRSSARARSKRTSSTSSC